MPDNFLKFITIGMGNAKSKRKGGPLQRSKYPFSSSDKDIRSNHETTRNNDFSIDIHERWAEDIELKIMRRTIDKDPEMFILNNLMMCVQFFENYDEEINEIRQTLVSTREAELNSRLPPQNHSLIPDVLQQHVARRVDFTYVLPTFQHTIELLQPIRIYVVFDNIEVTEENYASPYCSVNQTITYSMQLKPSPIHKGYVHLQRLEVNPPKKTASADDLRLPPLTNGTREEIYSDGDSIYGRKTNKRGGVARVKNVRNVNNEDSIYGDHRYGAQIFEYRENDRIKDDTNNQIKNGRTVGEEVTRKDADSGRPGTRNINGHYGKAKLLHLSNCSPAGSTSSGYKSGNYMDIDSDCSYAHTTYSSTPKTSKSSLDNDAAEILSTEIPRQCFKKMEYRADGTIYDPRRERRQKMSSKEQLIWQIHQSRNYDVWYLNSMKFMKYFCQLFTDHLAIPMGFEPGTNDDNIQGPVIYRDKIEALEGTMSTKLETFEIVPCISSQWPECAQEWIDRPRMSWPCNDVIEKVKEFGCHMIPEGSANDKATNKFHDLEWQLIFPAAERFLETCLTYPQVRVYLISLMLHKTYIKPGDSIFGLTISHIKNRLFWLIEEDDRPIKWMENRTGESLMRLLDSLYRSISQDQPYLPDFFIKQKNLFQENSSLLRTQKQLKRIIENPVMYVFHAMENIRHSRRFFPRLDYEELLKILTADKLTLVNPALVPQKTKSVGSNISLDKDYDQIGSFWEDVKQKNSNKTKTRIRKPITNRSLINPRKAYDQVVEIPIRCASMEPQRLASLLEFFIKHFIKMAECCHKYGAIAQKMAYVEQAERLSVLLSEHPLHMDDAKVYVERLCSLKRRATNARAQSEPPKTPRRNPDMPMFARPMNDRYWATESTKQNAQSSRTSDDSGQQEINDPLRSITRVIVHEENTEKPINVELRKSENVAVTEDETTVEKTRRPRIISLTEQTEESFLTETTYI